MTKFNASVTLDLANACKAAQMKYKLLQAQPKGHHP
jgi:hypothetical protein